MEYQVLLSLKTMKKASRLSSAAVVIGALVNVNGYTFLFSCNVFKGRQTL